MEENSIPLYFDVYTDGLVTTNQSEEGFTVKQGATTIHGSSSTCKVTQRLAEKQSAARASRLDCFKK